MNGITVEKDKVEKVLDWYGIVGKVEKLAKLTTYLEMVGKKRKWAGLMSRECAVGPEDAIVDSLGVLSAVSFAEEKNVVEIGSGGGLLGIVLAVVSPEWTITLAESSARKSVFLAEAIGSLGIVNAEVMNVRAERLAGEREFDVAVTRAAGKLSKTVPLALGLLTEGGLHVAVKGTDVESEIEDAVRVTALGGGRPKGVISPGYYRDLGMQKRTLLVVTEKM